MCQVVTMIKNLSVSHPRSDAIKKGCCGKDFEQRVKCFCFLYFAVQVCLCTVSVQYCWQPEEGLEFLELELQKVLSVLGIQPMFLWRNSQYF